MEFVKALFGQRVYLDANIFIYAYESHPRFIQEVTALFEATERGDIQAVTSELTLAEVLVRPIQNKNRAAQKAYKQAIQNSPHLVVCPMRADILIEAARLRATAQLTLPDAIHAATARISGCKAVVTNDAQFATVLGINTILLSQVIQPEGR